MSSLHYVRLFVGGSCVLYIMYVSLLEAHVFFTLCTFVCRRLMPSLHYLPLFVGGSCLLYIMYVCL